MRKFFAEFKKFITRGNVMDMAVGVIIGGAFSAIVSALTNHILMPVINWVLGLIIGEDGFSKFITPLGTRYYVEQTLEDGSTVQALDLTKTNYIDWGAFITAIINFILIALVLFLIIRTFNRVKDSQEKAKSDWTNSIPTKEERKEMKKRGINFKDKEAVAKFYQEKADKEAAEKAAAEEKARLEREANPTTEDLLKKILAAIEEKK